MLYNTLNSSSFVLSRNYYTVKLSSYLFLMRILHTEHKVSLNIITVSELKNTFTDMLVRARSGTQEHRAEWSKNLLF